MQAVSSAISREDWVKVAQLAPLIAQHDEPIAADKLRILGWLGKDVPTFKSFDTNAHNAAHEMAEAAEKGDGLAVIRAYGSIQQNCLACHQRFRKAFSEQFGQP
ncbi:cytochrome c [Burkholderiaceae bacterium DAT-1]|nr:cytochrome c [Burkholderiaceae bacterium DAT-1]